MIILEVILIVYFGYVTFYSLFFGICANMDRSRRKGLSYEELKWAKFCVLIPAYREDAVILHTAQKALSQSYQSSMFDVVVIADSLKQTTLEKLKALPVKLITVSFEKSTKVKSLNLALSQLSENYDYGVILDADNLMEEDFLEKVNHILYTTEARAIQGQRKPKNQQNTLSFLDAVSESINTSIFRRGTSVAGLSSSISGSGFAVEFKILKNLLATMSSIGGFDKELEILLLTKGIRVRYEHNLIVYDEKVSNAKHFENQRKRWISSQYYYLSKYFRLGISALGKGSISLFNSTILRNLQLPRLINIGLFTLITLLSFLLKDQLTLPYYYWIGLFAIHTLAIFVSIPKEYYSIRLLISIVSLPALFIRMVSAFFQIKKANKKFIHTPHEV